MKSYNISLNAINCFIFQVKTAWISKLCNKVVGFGWLMKLWNPLDCVLNYTLLRLHIVQLIVLHFATWTEQQQQQQTKRNPVQNLHLYTFSDYLQSIWAVLKIYVALQCQRGWLNQSIDPNTVQLPFITLVAISFLDVVHCTYNRVQPFFEWFFLVFFSRSTSNRKPNNATISTKMLNKVKPTIYVNIRSIFVAK